MKGGKGRLWWRMFRIRLGIWLGQVGTSIAVDLMDTDGDGRVSRNELLRWAARAIIEPVVLPDGKR